MSENCFLDGVETKNYLFDGIDDIEVIEIPGKIRNYSIDDVLKISNIPIKVVNLYTHDIENKKFYWKLVREVCAHISPPTYSYSANYDGIYVGAIAIAPIFLLKVNDLVEGEHISISGRECVCIDESSAISTTIVTYYSGDKDKLDEFLNSKEFEVMI